LLGAVTDKGKKTSFLSLFILKKRFSNYFAEEPVKSFLHFLEDDVLKYATMHSNNIMNSTIACEGERNCGDYLLKGLPDDEEITKFRKSWQFDHMRDKAPVVTQLAKAIEDIDKEINITETQWEQLEAQLNTMKLRKSDQKIIENHSKGYLLFWVQVHCLLASAMEINEALLDYSKRINKTFLLEFLFGSNLQLINNKCHDTSRHENPLQLHELLVAL